MVSRIGKLAVQVPAGVEVQQQGAVLRLKGPKGESSYTVPALVSVEVADGQILVSAKDDSNQAQSLHGLARSLIANQLTGLTEGFTKRLQIVGTGYQAQINGEVLNLRLGYSHPVTFPQPPGITFSVAENVISVVGVDKQQVGEVAANIRKLRPPEPYKGKGIRYVDEVVRRKAGKAGKV
jgi:large subunit ribosomal protein L6